MFVCVLDEIKLLSKLQSKYYQNDGRRYISRCSFDLQWIINGKAYGIWSIVKG